MNPNSASPHVRVASSEAHRHRTNGFVRSIGLLLIAAMGACNSQIPTALLCPSDQDSFAEMNKATYAVVVEFKVGPKAEDVAYFTLATSFAIGEHLLGTNSHVTNFFKEEQPFPISKVYGVQSGTGATVTLLRALTHPEYTGNPFRSPDVGLLTTQEALPMWLPLASDFEVSDLAVGDQLLLTGFPGDVDEQFPITPGTTVPQASSLSGPITALRNHDDTQIVDPSNVDVVQHQIPTSKGTSGSALVRCGEVIAVHNAGLSRAVIQNVGGELKETVVPTAANNFGVHVRYMREMVTLFQNQTLQGFELPPPFNGGQNPGGGQGQGVAQFAGNYAGNMTQPATATHSFTFTINQDGTITGTSTWPTTGNFTLTGEVDATGNIAITDDAQQRMGFNTGIYAGQIAANGQVSGGYFEGNTNNFIGNWTAAK
jgi:Trypsin-like peptidase domain